MQILNVPTIQISDIKKGDDILVGHHLLIAPALMLDRKLTIDEGGFLDFCTMVNLAAIHKHLIVLPGHLDESIIQSSLYQYLIDDGILHELDFPSLNYDKNDQDEVRELLRIGIPEGDVPDADIMQVLYGKLYYDELLRRDGVHYVTNPELENNTPEMREKFVNQVIESAKITRGHPTYLDPTPTRPDQKSTLYVHRLRTAAYWMVAGKLGLSFAPEFIRIPIVATYVAQRKAAIDWHIRDLIQKTVDSIAREELENTRRMKTAELMPIPNSALNFLNRYASNGDLKKSFRDTREEYERYNTKIIEWEKQEFDPEINPTKKEKLLKDVAETIRDSLSDDKRTVAIIQAAFNVSLNPGSTLPLTKEIWDLLKKYRSERRVFYFMHGMKEASLVSQHPRLLEYAFCKSFDSGQLQRFKDLVDALDTFSLGAVEERK